MTEMILFGAVQSAAHPWGHTGGWWWIPFVVVFWGAVAAIVHYLIVHVRAPRQQSGIDRARDILAERLARGEIDSEEYFERVSSLS
jgi:uncharacterized membrane protein